MKRTLWGILLIFYINFSYCQKITIGGFNTPKEYFQDHMTKHYYAGMLISGTVGWSINYFTEKPVTSILIGTGVGMLAGICKEAIWDKRLGYGVCNNYSAYMTMWGSAVSGIVNIVIIDIQHKKKHYAKWKFEESKLFTENLKY